MSAFQPLTIARDVAMPLMSGAKLDTNEPGSLNCAGEFAPSPPNTFARLPCSISCWPNVCASGGCCVGKKTKSASLGVRVTRDEKSVVRTDVESRITSTFRARRTCCAASARPTEYGSWKSMITTLSAFLLIMNRRRSAPG